MKRYRWSVYSRVYHDMNYATERCFLKEQKSFTESDEPPEQLRHRLNRKLCAFCRRHRNQVEMSEWRSPEKPYNGGTDAPASQSA